MSKRIIFILILFLAVSVNGLESSNDCNTIGEITGWDATRCACCEGWKIKIGDRTFLSDSIPNRIEIMGPSEDIRFPIPIYLDFERAKYCSKNRIVITCIRKR